jgi:hypothetical protein
VFQHVAGADFVTVDFGHGSLHDRMGAKTCLTFVNAYIGSKAGVQGHSGAEPPSTSHAMNAWLLCKNKPPESELGVHKGEHAEPQEQKRKPNERFRRWNSI